MSKILKIAAIVILLPVAVFSQVRKGDNCGTGDVSFLYHHNSILGNDNVVDKSNQLAYSLNLDLSHFVANRLAIGSGLVLGTSTSAYSFHDQDGNSNSSKFMAYSVGLNPSVRYYLCDSTRLNWFLGFKGIFSYSWDKITYTSSQENSENSSTMDGFDYGGTVSFGSVYFITRNIGLEGQIYYQVMATKSNQGNTNNYLYQSVGISAGLMFYLGKSGK